MIGVEDDLEGGEGNKRGESLKPRIGKKRRINDCDVVGSLRNMMMTGESRRFMTAAVEGMNVGGPESVS
jgi:hypothetical protein